MLSLASVSALEVRVPTSYYTEGGFDPLNPITNIFDDDYNTYATADFGAGGVSGVFNYTLTGNPTDVLTVIKPYCVDGVNPCQVTIGFYDYQGGFYDNWVTYDSSQHGNSLGAYNNPEFFMSSNNEMSIRVINIGNNGGVDAYDSGIYEMVIEYEDTPTNTAPIVDEMESDNNGAAFTTQETQTWTLQVTDNEGDASYKWYTGVNTVLLNEQIGETGLSFTINGADYTPDQYVVVGVAYDGEFSTNQTRIFTVEAGNTAPTITNTNPVATTQNIDLNTSVDFNINYVDNEGDAVVEWYLDNALYETNNIGTLIQFYDVFGYNYGETHTVYATVTDGEFAVNSSLYTININEYVPTFSCGDGTELNPYCVSTVADFENMDYFVEAYYKQVNDIDFENVQSEVVGVTDANFGSMLRIKYDGQNYTLKNRRIVQTGSYIGLFGAIDDDFHLENVNIENIYLQCLTQGITTREGTIYGRSYGANTIENVNIKNATLTGQNCEKGGIGGIESGTTLTNVSIDGLNLGSSGRKGLVFGNGNFAATNLAIKNVIMPSNSGANMGLTGYDTYSGSLTNAYFDNITFTFTGQGYGLQFIGTFNNVIFNNIEAEIGNDALIDSTNCNNVYYVNDNINITAGNGAVVNPTCAATNITEEDLVDTNVLSGLDFINTWALKGINETPFLRFENYVEYVPPPVTIDITNITILPTGNVSYNEDLAGVCEVFVNNSEEVETYTHGWKVNGVDVLYGDFNNFNILTADTQYVSYENNIQNLAVNNNAFNFTPSYILYKNENICGVNYWVEMCGQTYQNSIGIFHSNYNINAIGESGSPTFEINNGCITNDEVTVNITTQFACPFSLGGTVASFRVKEEAPLYNSNILQSEYFSDGDTVTYTCETNITDLSDYEEVNKVITYNELAPSGINIYSPNGSYTLNSTGTLFNFNYDAASSNPPANYNVYLTNGFIDLPVKIATSLTNFNEVLSSTTTPLSDTYNIKVVAYNEHGFSTSVSEENLTICVNEWTAQYTTCVEDLNVVTYYDANLCADQYDRPLNHNTTVSCDDGLFTEAELQVQEEQGRNDRLMLIIGLIIIVSSILLAVGRLPVPMVVALLLQVVLIIGSILILNNITHPAFKGIIITGVIIQAVMLFVTFVTNKE